MVQIQKGMRSGVCEALEAFVALLKATESALEQLIVERTQQRTERGLKASEAEIRSRTWQKWTFFRSAPQARKIYMLWQPILNRIYTTFE
jgi:hypothetical protein